MERTQIYLTEREHERLQQLSRSLGKSQSELIRDAIDRVYLPEITLEERLALLQASRGGWKGERPSVDLRSARRMRAVSRSKP
jgi:hypothetical protein